MNENVSNSNASGAHMHIPLHTNARTESCTDTVAANHGTQGFYVSTSGANCATSMASKVGSLSPGTTDTSVYRTNLAELNNTNAVACYLEAEFHTWNSGVTWIRDEVDWTWRIGWTVDAYYGYP